MEVFKYRIFQSSFIKQIKFLFSAQKAVQNCFLVSEQGTLSLLDLPLSTTVLVEHEQNRMSWSNIQNLKIMIQGKETPVLPINERSLYPLDPYGKLTADEKRNQASLPVIAETEYIKAQSNVAQGKDESAQAKMAKSVLWALAIIALAVMLTLLIRGGS